jgi:hypothetical protein
MAAGVVNMTLRYFIGLDLGPAGEYAALAVLERPRMTPRNQAKPAYALRHLQRYALGTPYPAIVEDTRTLLRTPPMPGSILVIDKTGVGQAVLKLFQDGLKDRVCCGFWPVTIAAGLQGETYVNGRMSVAKQELVGTLQVLLQTRRLQVAKTLPETTELVRELEAFRTKPTKLTGEVEVMWREGPHNDLVLAVALAGWVGERCLPEVGAAPVVVGAPRFQSY